MGTLPVGATLGDDPCGMDPAGEYELGGGSHGPGRMVGGAPWKVSPVAPLGINTPSWQCGQATVWPANSGWTINPPLQCGHARVNGSDIGPVGAPGGGPYA